MRGKITKTISGRDFFFIDGDYFCHISKVDFEPKINDEVEYEQSKNQNGKFEARNVRRIGTATTPFDRYLKELSAGYFEDGYIKSRFLMEIPKELAQLFGQDPSVNKSTQMRNFFDFCRRIEGIFKSKKDFNYVKSELPKLMYHISNAFRKKLVSNEFKTFIEKNVELAIQNEENFQKGFMNHFEAVIGYSKN